jgi:hypothetical protein
MWTLVIDMLVGQLQEDEAASSRSKREEIAP